MGKYSHDNYSDIIDMPHHVSKRFPQMGMEERAAQFGSFDALSGFKATIQETARRTEQLPELSDDEKEKIDRVLRQAAAELPVVHLTIFIKDERKDGGLILETRGRIKKIDPYTDTVFLEDGRRLEIGYILGAWLDEGEEETGE